MRIFYIDYENVRTEGLRGIDKIDTKTKVFLVCGINDCIRLIDVNYIMKSKAKLEILPVQTGKKDALDFQLVTHLMLKYNKKNEYVIISKDQGYDFAIEMAKTLGKENIKRFDTILSANEAYEEAKKSKVESNNCDNDISIIAPMIVGNISQGETVYMQSLLSKAGG